MDKTIYTKINDNTVGITVYTPEIPTTNEYSYEYWVQRCKDIEEERIAFNDKSDKDLAYAQNVISEMDSLGIYPK